MKTNKLDFSDCLEGLVDLADYLLALRGKKAECNTIDFVEPLSDKLQEELHNELFEIESNLETALFSLIRNLLKAKGILNDSEDCDYENLQDLHELIIEKGKDGYSELLDICKSEHLEFGIINSVVTEEE